MLHLWLASSALDSAVIGWAFYDGTAGSGPAPQGDPPYATGVAALVDGWHLLQISALLRPTPETNAKPPTSNTNSSSPASQADRLV